MAARLGFPIFVLRLGGGLLRRPGLMVTAVRQAKAMAPNGWWRRAPYLPVPPADYLHFRQVTATGDAEGSPSVHDTLVWLEWCRSMRQLPERVA
ncbi:MAG: hypothetical protein AAF567_15285 [Actinomycetota bacterium]